MRKKIREYIKQFFLIDDTPHKVAGGAALGAFMGIMPGEGVASTLLLAYIFRLNRLSALAGVLVFNMWMTLLVLPFSAAVGGLVFRIEAQALVRDFHETVDLGWQYFFSWNIFRETALPLLTGYLIIAGVISFLLYSSLLYLLIKKKKLKKKSHILTNDKINI
jgi:uncharacterized protein (DUF2062 family)